MLLGVLREEEAVDNSLGSTTATREDIRNEIAVQLTVKEKVSTSVDLPLTPECNGRCSAPLKKPERCGHKHIGTDHLMSAEASEVKNKRLRRQRCWRNVV